MSEQQQFEIPIPPKEAFASRLSDPLQGEEIISYISEKIEHVLYEGILVHIKGATYPRRGFPTPEAVHINNVIKTLIKQALLSPKVLIFKLIFQKTHLCVSFNKVFKKAFSSYLLKEEYLSPVSRSLSLLIFNLLVSYNIPKDVAKYSSIAFANILEYDDAYRYRLQDIISETTYYRLQYNPHQEITRLFHVFQLREQTSTTAMDIYRIVSPLLILLKVPSIRKKFIRSLDNNIVNGMKYTPMDQYWANLKGDLYLFGGKTYDERTKNITIPQAYRIS